MAYRIKFRSSFERDIKKRFKKNKPAKLLIQKHLDEILENPECGAPYSGNLYPLKKVAFGDSPQYRIIFATYFCCDINSTGKCNQEEGEEQYPIENCEGIIEFCFVKTREDCSSLYSQNKKYFQNVIRDLAPK